MTTDQKTVAVMCASGRMGQAQVLELLAAGHSPRAISRTSDVFVLPTLQDTYAAVVHEAACLGLPLLVSKHAGAADDHVHHDVEGRN